MERTAWLACYEAAPPVVQDYLLDRQASRNEEKAQAALAYDNDAWDRVMDVVWETVFTGLPQADFRERLSRLAGDRKPEDVEKAVLFNVVLPMGDLVLWDVDTRLQELGVSLTEIQGVPRISLRPVSYGAASRRIASRAKISVLQEEMFRRLREALVSFIKGVRAIEQVKEILMRNQGEGGLGFSPEQAERYVKAMNDFLATTQVISEQEYADWMTVAQREAEVKKVVGAQLIAPVQGSEDEQIAQMAARTPKGPAGPLDEAVAATVQKAAVPNLDELFTRRLGNIISTRLRDVRNPIQIKAILARDTKVGGLGLEAIEAERVANIIEEAYGSLREPIADEEKRQIQAILTEQQIKIGERKKRESEEHARWFAEKAKQRPEEVLRRVMKGEAPPAFAEAMAGRPETVAAGGMQKGVQARVSVPSARVSEGMGMGRPTLDEVSPPLHLTGLTEELGGMTSADFRRLAKTPEQAADKIRQKLDTLKNESFDRWVEGVEAWRKSPLQQQYLKIVAESFAKGKPVAEIVEEKRTSDPDLPTSEELGAIISLNSKEQY